MNKRYSFYCSGGAGRLIKFYERNRISDYKIEFILYDGDNHEVVQKLKKTFGDILILFEKKNGLSIALYDLLNYHKIDYLFCFGSKILKGDLIEKYKNRIINFHPSLLPAFPGRKSIDQALDSSVQILGNTAHFIDKGVDTGPIIMQSVVSRSAYNEYGDEINSYKSSKDVVGVIILEFGKKIINNYFKAINSHNWVIVD